MVDMITANRGRKRSSASQGRVAASGVCEEIAVLLLDPDEVAREHRAGYLRHRGHTVRCYAAPRDLPPASELPRKAVLIARQELPCELGIECLCRVQRVRPDIPAILLADVYSPALAATASTRKATWLRTGLLSDAELHSLVDLCSA